MGLAPLELQGGVESLKIKDEARAWAERKIFLNKSNQTNEFL
jgi:hypothetical protein